MFEEDAVTLSAFVRMPRLLSFYVAEFITDFAPSWGGP